MSTDTLARPSLADALPEAWRDALVDACSSPALVALDRFLTEERGRSDTSVHPSPEDLFSALRLTPLHAVRAVILGQDPYHGVGEAHGLAFSVRPGARIPPSLRNILAERADDVGGGVPGNGSLESWARNGVLLLNTVLTVRRDEPDSHRGRGWEAFSDAVIRAVADRPEPIAFLLWGARAQGKRELIDPRHVVVASNHPSPLSATRPPTPFRGSRPFSTVNARLAELGRPPIDWSLPGD